MRSLLVIALAACFTTSAMAKIWTVSQTPGANFTTLASAVASASVLAGDTLLVAGAPLPYAGATITKKLTIIGPGFFLGENTGLQADTFAVTITSDVTVNGAAPGTTLMGLTFSNSTLYINADNVTVLRCRSLISVTNRHGIYLFAQDSVVVRQCYLYTPTTSQYSCIYAAATSTQTMIQNNYIEGTVQGGYNAVFCDVATGGIVSNNVMSGNVNVKNVVFNNNIQRTGSFTVAGITPFNNIGNSTQFGTVNGNQENVSMSAVFIGTGTSDARWQIVTSGPADNTGFGGVDCGMFDTSTNTAYVLSGLPPIPSIYNFTATSDLSTVTVKVKSNN